MHITKKKIILTIFIILIILILIKTNTSKDLVIETQKQIQEGDDWKTITEKRAIYPNKTALIIIDMGDTHHCEPSLERMAVLAPKIDKLATHLREKGIKIIHAVGHNLVDSYYKNHQARINIRNEDFTKTFIFRDTSVSDLNLPPLPFDNTILNCDGDDSMPWPPTRIHPSINIDDSDLISDKNLEIFDYLYSNDIDTVLITGVHLNMCVLELNYGTLELMKAGFEPILVKDLTDSMYDPKEYPYVSHKQGTKLVIDYFEKYLIPATKSSELM